MHKSTLNFTCKILQNLQISIDIYAEVCYNIITVRETKTQRKRSNEK
nr:MAG TPA: hypothetical protein [Caudoviricetes sp.]